VLRTVPDSFIGFKELYLQVEGLLQEGRPNQAVEYLMGHGYDIQSAMEQVNAVERCLCERKERSGSVSSSGQARGISDPVQIKRLHESRPGVNHPALLLRNTQYGLERNSSSPVRRSLNSLGLSRGPFLQAFSQSLPDPAKRPSTCHLPADEQAADEVFGHALPRRTPKWA
jgi:hypothetical protein